MTHLGDGRFLVRLRLPNALLSKYLVLEVCFRYGWEHLAWAIDAGQALSYRFARDAKGWRIFASTAAVPIAIDCELERGALGVDLNAGHVALSLTKRDGNLASVERLALVTYGQSSDRAAALVGDAVKEIVSTALRARVPIVVEKLDFAKKKARLRENGACYARMLSSFAYRRFVQTLCARAHDAGIAVIFVNSAYSSLIGRRKFARRYGISGHQAAALVLARRAQKFSERPNRLALRSPVRKNARHVWSSWVRIAREEARGGLYGRSRHGRRPARDPSAAAAVGAIIPTVAGGTPARESVASTVSQERTLGSYRNSSG
jgi:IS605 OrfB family transposase